MKESPFKIRRDMIDPAANALSEAFQNDPLFSWLIPEPLFRCSLLPLFFHYRVQHGLFYGEVYATSQKLRVLLFGFHTLE